VGCTILLPWLITVATTAAEAPLVGRPRQDYYGAVANRLKVSFSTARTRMKLGDETTLTLQLEGALNSPGLQRPDLASMESFSAEFYVDDLDEGPEQPRASRYFRYRLRPKREGTLEIPAILYRYYQPDMAYFATTVAAAAEPLIVEPRDVTQQGSALESPSFLFAADERIPFERRSFVRQEHVAIAIAWVLPALAFVMWYVWWRLHNPNAARLARLRHNDSIRRVLDAIAADRNPAELATIMRSYLQQRFEMPATTQTTAELLLSLDARGSSPTLQKAAATFLHACDEWKFGPVPVTDGRHAKLAEAIILEAEVAT